MGHSEEGEVKDLMEKLETGELVKEEVLAEMEKRGLLHHANEPIPGIFALSGFLAWIVMCFLPVICKILGLDVLDFPSVKIPLQLVYAATLFALVAVPPLFYSAYLREKRSVTGDENIVLVRSGGYGVVRHPTFLAGLIIFIALSIISTLKIPFTILSVFGDMALFAGLYLQTWNEEKINIKKWGDKYRQYMKEVPRFNFIMGLWNIRKKR